MFVRMKAFVPMIGPLVLSSIQQIEERVLTLESRAFSSGAKKTSIYELKKQKADYLIITFVQSFNQLYCLEDPIMSILSLKNISYKYPLENNETIHDVSFEFEKGRVYGLVGANESGKTTLCISLEALIPELYKGQLVGDVMVKGNI